MNYALYCAILPNSFKHRSSAEKGASTSVKAKVNSRGAWIVIHMVRSLSAAKRLEQKLAEEGILVRLQPVYKNRGDEDNYYEILVLSAESEAARETIFEKGF